MALLETSRHLLLAAVMIYLRGANAMILHRHPFSRRSTQIRAKSTIPSVSTLDLVERVKETIHHDILHAGKLSHQHKTVTMILGVSGGCDSVALLHILQKIRHRSWDIRIVHFDHQQRGHHSDGDRIFTERLCGDYGLPFDCYFWEDYKHQLPSEAQVVFSQDSARKWRRSKMYEMRQKQPNRTFLLTAHHKDDSEETLLLKLLRGVHLTNLSGLPPLSHDGAWGRPLINVRKSEILHYLQLNGWEWREDHSNRSPKYLRNRVRNELIPLLTDLVGEKGLERRLENLQDQASDVRIDMENRVDIFLSNQSDGTFLLPTDRGDLYLTMEAFHEWAKRRGCCIDFDQMQRLKAQIKRHEQRRWTLDIGHHWSVSCRGDCLSLDNTKETPTEGASRTVSIEWSVVVEGGALEDKKDSVVVVVPSTEVETIQFALSTASDQPQKLFNPPWRRKPMKVSEFLRGQKVPLHRRAEAPVIVAHDGIVAVYVDVECRRKWIVDTKYVDDCDSHTNRGRTRIALSIESARNTTK